MMDVRGNVLAVLDGKALAIEGVKGLTDVEVAVSVGITRNTAKRHLNAAHDAKLVHVADWRRSASGPPAPLYRAGEGRDKPKPKPYTDNQRALRYIARHSALVRARKAKATGTLNHYAQLIAR